MRGVHDTSFHKMRVFVDTHLAPLRDTPLEILDFGAQMVDDQGLTYRMLLDAPVWNYRGLDIAAGHNVDIVVDDPYDWTAVECDSVDLVVSGQAFEHVQFFWASTFEIVRVLRPGGLAVIIAPSGGVEHRYPIDCWRFYEDGFVALAEHVGCDVLDAFTDWGHDEWEDSILVARKPIWTRRERATFRQRAALQRSILSDEVDLDRLAQALDDEPATLPAPSPLRHTRPGAVREHLVAERNGRAAAAEAAKAARADEPPTPAPVAPVPQPDGPAPQPDGLVEAYGRMRARIAETAGPRGRSLYKRLRRRD